MQEILWAPWRQEYINRAVKKTPKKGRCFLCEKARAKELSRNHILTRDGLCLSTMNLFPYNSGHVLIAPLRHTDDFLRLSDDELHAIMKHAQKIMRALTRALNPHGFNMGFNIGRSAGAGVKGHIHFHIVPRWDGDTNFMPVFSRCKVMPESLEKTFRKIKKYLPR
jgi:ATP adenylyltransferase